MYLRPRRYAPWLWFILIIMLISYGNSASFAIGNCIPGTWQYLTTSGAPTERNAHTAVWTGSEMIVWGGNTFNSVVINTGGRYNPTSDFWQALSTNGAPPGRRNLTSVWTGTEMIVWGGRITGSNVNTNTGGRYNPATDQWASTSTGSNVPSPRVGPSSVWTGTEMIVWCGSVEGVPLPSGGRYNPVTDTWTPVSTLNAPQACPPLAWTGTEMIVPSFPGSSGGAYNPYTDTWYPISTIGAPTDIDKVVWAGSELLTFGGVDGQGRMMGAAYNLTTDSWRTISPNGVMAFRNSPSIVWTGKEAILWGGFDSNFQFYNDGSGYNPTSDTWTPVVAASNLTPRALHNAVWTGSQMIIWGGTNFTIDQNRNDGGLYCPLNHTPIANAGSDLTISCSSPSGTAVTLDGSGSSDLDGDSLTYIWTGPFPEGGGTVHGVSPSVTLPMGISTMSLTVNDGFLDSSPDSVNVNVVVGLSGLQQPFTVLTPEGDGVFYPDKAFKQGRVLSLKLTLSCGSTPLTDQDVSAPQIISLTRAGDPIDLETIDIDVGGQGDSNLLFRFANGVWIYNLSTQNLGTGSYIVTIQMPDQRRFSSGFVLR